MIFFSDFDGTLTVKGSGLTPDFFEIIDLINKNGHELVVVSGRSISWGHFLLTHFPLKACIMEGGGVITYKDENGEIQNEPLVSEVELNRLQEFTTNLTHHYPHVPLSADSFGRLSDRAIEFKLMSPEWIEEVTEYMSRENVSFTRSNVHINFWCGQISKFLGVQHFLQHHRAGLKESDSWFFGDAPNDESMFEFFHNSVGVSNISECLDRLNHKPRIILEGPENNGPKGVLNFIRTLI